MLKIFLLSIISASAVSASLPTHEIYEHELPKLVRAIGQFPSNHHIRYPENNFAPHYQKTYDILNSKGPNAEKFDYCFRVASEGDPMAFTLLYKIANQDPKLAQSSFSPTRVFASKNGLAAYLYGISLSPSSFPNTMSNPYYRLYLSEVESGRIPKEGRDRDARFNIIGHFLTLAKSGGPEASSHLKEAFPILKKWLQEDFNPADETEKKVGSAFFLGSFKDALTHKLYNLCYEIHEYLKKMKAQYPFLMSPYVETYLEFGQNFELQKLFKRKTGLNLYNNFEHPGDKGEAFAASEKRADAVIQTIETENKLKESLVYRNFYDLWKNAPKLHRFLQTDEGKKITLYDSPEEKQKRFARYIVGEHQQALITSSDASVSAMLQELSRKELSDLVVKALVAPDDNRFSKQPELADTLIEGSLSALMQRDKGVLRLKDSLIDFNSENPEHIKSWAILILMQYKGDLLSFPNNPLNAAYFMNATEGEVVESIEKALNGYFNPE